MRTFRLLSFFLSVLCLSSFVYSQNIETAKINIDCAITHPRKSYIGFLHGFYGFSKEEARRLNPGYWRSPNESAIPSIVKKLGMDYSIEFTFLTNGHKPGSKHVTIDKTTKGQYIDFVKNHYKKHMRLAKKNNYRLKYFEFANEPVGRYVWKPMAKGEKVNKTERLFYAYKLFHDTMRKLDSDAILIAPSFSHYWPDLMEDFIKRCSESNITIDAFCWHVIDARPEEIPKQVAFVRNLMKKYPNVGIKEIHINEWGWINIGVASQMSYFFYMEKSGVDLAAKALFGVEPLGNLMTMDGLLIKIYKKPENIPRREQYHQSQGGSKPLPKVSYWAWEFYSKLGKNGYRVTTDNPYVTCLAAPDKEDSRVIRMIIGKASQTKLYTSNKTKEPARVCPKLSPSINVSVSIDHLPFNDSIEMEIISLPATDWALTKDVKDSFAIKYMKKINNGKLMLDFSHVKDEEVFLVTIKRSKIKH